MDLVIFILVILIILAQDIDGQLQFNESTTTRVDYPFKYSAGIGGKLNMKVVVINKPAEVSDALLVYHHGAGSESMLTLLLSLVNKTSTVVDITHPLDDLLWLDIMLRNNTEICAVKTIARADFQLSEESVSADLHTNNTSLACARERACSIKVDLGNKCEESGVEYVPHDFGFDWNSTIEMSVTIINMPVRASTTIARLAIGSGNVQDTPARHSRSLPRGESFVEERALARAHDRLSIFSAGSIEYKEFIPGIVFDDITLRTSTQIVMFLHDSDNQLCSVKTVFNVREPVINILRGDQYTYNCSVSKRHCDVTLDFENKCEAQKRDKDRSTSKRPNSLPATTTTTPTSATFANTTEVNNSTIVEVGSHGDYIRTAALVTAAVLGNCVLTIIIVVIVRRKKAKRARPPAPLPTVEFSPFYLNMLFREQCQREIEAEEDAHYEQIDEEAYYEQID